MGGGLVVYETGPIPEWDHMNYNSERLNPRITEFVKATNYKNLTIPYVQNRAVIFDSSYFHVTDRMAFQKGYTNRRINLTYLYGRRSQLKSRAVFPRMETKRTRKKKE